MTALEQAAAELSHELSRDAEMGPVVAFDPATIVLLVEAIVELVKLVRECRKTPAEGLALAKDPGVVTLVRMLRRLASVFPLHPLLLLRVFHAVRAVAARTDEQKVVAVFAAVPTEPNK